MTIVSKFYTGGVNGQAWAEGQAALGNKYWVEDDAAARVSVVSSATRTIRFNLGKLGGHGVFDEITVAEDIALDEPGSGSIWYTASMRRDWQPDTEPGTVIGSSCHVTAGTSAKAIAASLIHNKGTQDDQPLALVQITKDEDDPTGFVDLRCVGIGHGYYLAYDVLALTYLNDPGTRVRINGTTYLCLLDRSWTKIETPVETMTSPSQFLTNMSGWSTSGHSQKMIRDGRWRSLMVEQHAADATRLTSSDSTGNIGDVATFQLTNSRDFPANTHEDVPFRYRYREDDGYYAYGNGRFATDGRFILSTTVPGLDLYGTGSGGDYDLRMTLDYYAGDL